MPESARTVTHRDCEASGRRLPTPTPTPTSSPTPTPNPNPDRDQGDLLSSLALKDPSKVKKIAAFEGELAYEKSAEKSATALQAYPNPNPNPNP